MENRLTRDILHPIRSLPQPSVAVLEDVLNVLPTRIDPFNAAFLADGPTPAHAAPSRHAALQWTYSRDRLPSSHSVVNPEHLVLWIRTRAQKP